MTRKGLSNVVGRITSAVASANGLDMSVAEDADLACSAVATFLRVHTKSIVTQSVTSVGVELPENLDELISQGFANYDATLKHESASKSAKRKRKAK